MSFPPQSVRRGLKPAGDPTANATSISKPTYAPDAALFDDLFPFHLLFSKDMRVTQVRFSYILRMTVQVSDIHSLSFSPTFRIGWKQSGGDAP